MDICRDVSSSYMHCYSRYNTLQGQGERTQNQHNNSHWVSQKRPMMLLINANENGIQYDLFDDGFYGMPTYVGHFMPKIQYDGCCINLHIKT